MGTLYVMSHPGQPCPRERSRETISDIAPVAVPNTTYYRRRVADGSLIKCDRPASPVVRAEKPTKKEKK